MNVISFCECLVNRVTPEEWALLERDDSPLLVNDHNRNALLEMRDVVLRNTDASNSVGVWQQREIDIAKAAALERELQAYLDEYMSEAPEGHKWIILASLYLTFVAKRPMHPVERVGVSVVQRDGHTVYRCPAKVPGDNPICDNCICEPQ